MDGRVLLRCCVLALATASCGAVHTAGRAVATAVKGPPKPVPEARDVETRLFLIGDAGVPAPKDAVLASLAHDVGADPQHAVVVFLGDNAYPRGLPEDGSLLRKDAERRLDAQIAAAHGDASTIFIPGNHDWNRMSPGGWDAVRREGAYIDEKGGPSVSMLPKGGCPGPEVRDIDTRLRLVLLDTQWWLQPPPKPEGKGSSCATHTEAEVVDALIAALRGAGGRAVVVAGHHPLATGGAHGGYFSWQDHIFPLRAERSWLWIPLPGIGSLYPLSRIYGVSAQDMGGTLNRKMREALSGAFEKAPPLVYVAGHEHSLQVFKGQNAKYLLVSGAGAFNHVTQTAWTQSTLFAEAVSGYMRLDIEKGGRVRLAVVTVDGHGKAGEATALELQPGGQPPPAGPPAAGGATR